MCEDKIIINADQLISFYEACLNQANWATYIPQRFDDGIWHWIERNHRYNNLLWNEEDQARRTDVSDSLIAANKRAIDQYNQMRNDAVEKIDDILLGTLADVQLKPNCRLNSETAGNMMDRLSILSLKIFHMRLQTLRTDAHAEHVHRCNEKLARLLEQRHDLASCLNQLLSDFLAGVVHYKIYRQFKMYNDPTLNPYLHANRA